MQKNEIIWKCFHENWNHFLVVDIVSYVLLHGWSHCHCTRDTLMPSETDWTSEEEWRKMLIEFCYLQSSARTPVLPWCCFLSANNTWSIWSLNETIQLFSLRQSENRVSDGVSVQIYAALESVDYRARIFRNWAKHTHTPNPYTEKETSHSNFVQYYRFMHLRVILQTVARHNINTNYYPHYSWFM